MIHDNEINQQGMPEDAADNEQQECQDKLKYMQEQYAYLAADFDNYRKRQDAERARHVVVIQSAVFRDLLPIIDDLDRAVYEARKRCQEGPDDASAGAAVIAGMALIEKNMQKLRDKYQLQEIAIDIPFDPEMHEAIMQVDAPGHVSGDIVDVLEKGYTIRGVLLRPARVSVAR